MSVVSWIHSKAFSVRGVSVIWKGFIHTLSWLGRGLTWHVGNGETIRVGLDPIVGMGSPYSLPKDLWEYLEDYGILSLDQVRNYSPDARSYWLTADDLDLGGDWKLIWNSYISRLEHGRIRLKPGKTHYYGLSKIMQGISLRPSLMIAYLIFYLIFLLTCPMYGIFFRRLTYQQKLDASSGF